MLNDVDSICGQLSCNESHGVRFLFPNSPLYPHKSSYHSSCAIAFEEHILTIAWAVAHNTLSVFDVYSSYWQQGQLPSCSLFVEAKRMTYLDNSSNYRLIRMFQATCNLLILISLYSEFKHNEQIQMLRVGELTIRTVHFPVWANYSAGRPIPQATPRYRQKGWN